MIVRDQDGELVIVRQADHAYVSGQLAAAWGAVPWQPPEPFPAVVVGARQHDDAWLTFDEAPELGDHGKPLSFFEVDRVLTSDIYRRGVDAVCAIDQYAGLLVSLHYSGFFHSHFGWQPFALPDNFSEPQAGALRDFVDGELKRQQELRRAIGLDGADEAGLAANYQWLQLWDRISLDVCRQDSVSPWAVDYPETPVTGAAGAPRVSLKFAMTAPGEYVLNPYPLRVAPFHFTVIAARVRRDSYTTREQFLDVWRGVQPALLRARVSPP